MKIFYRLSLTFIFYAAYQVSAFAGFEDRRFEEGRINLVNEIIIILIAHGICDSQIGCQKMQTVFVSPISGGVGVQIWGIERSEVIKKISARCADFFNDQKDMDLIHVDFYFNKKQESLNSPFWRIFKPAIVLKFRRNR